MKDIEQLLAEGATAPNQQEYRLAVMADADASLSGYITAWYMSSDVLMKNWHFQRAVEVTRHNPTRRNYSRAYLFCRDIGKEETAGQLLDEMKERYPLFCSVQALSLKMAALFRRS